ncbi:hypothetical protein JCM11491_002652 [Sporobolomyces phaffii]
MSGLISSAVDSIRGTGKSKLLRKSPDDVVVTFARRTPLQRARKGQYKDMSVQELLLEYFRKSIPEMKIDPAIIGDICVGTVLPPKAPYDARAAALAAGIPDTVPLQIINRFCSSGLMAVQNISNAIRNGEIDVGLAVGFESMSATPDRGADSFAADVLAHPVAKDTQYPMGWTSENVSKDFNITRERMDELAALSQQRAEKAQATGLFDTEILPIDALVLPTATPAASGGPAPSRVKARVTKDDGIRPGTTKEKLAKIKSAFPQWGNGATTGGNASQITDGVAGVLLMTRRKAEELGLEILGKHVCTSVAGLPPRIMGIGPSVAIPKVLERAGISKDDVDLWEVNEAFASMYSYMIDHFGLPLDRTNVNGGAIALGHPLGCTGARQIATGLHETRRRGGKILVTSMCIGLGMGAAAVFVAE